MPGSRLIVRQLARLYRLLRAYPQSRFKIFGTTDVDAKRLAVSEARRSLGYTDEHR
jgi:hypothetical protein